MLLSILIPVYNAEKYIERCLNSILEQDFEEGEYEIILIDDGLVDESVSIIERICSKPNFSKYF
jgi:glycosyltransferase involved in cell wall biosynthesis